MRTKNFGLEPEETLLSPDTVAAMLLNTLFSTMRGEVVDVKLKKLQ
jgi:2-C-methyl-D-erythritol 4-phosphate cytidylyltransferase